jgi:hypothetical protein
VPLHSRMRAPDRDLIRGGHYGQRSCEPRKQAEHMAAPTNSANVKISLANSEPSTHGTKRTSQAPSPMSAFGGKADIAFEDQNNEIEELLCAAPNIKQLQFALIARPAKASWSCGSAWRRVALAAPFRSTSTWVSYRSAESSVIQPRD